ncbi:molybdate transport system regulatory protein [Flavobacterium sp. 103]|nr:molybdate transport system regulatory protein [Flavobacterium sp. 103]
MQIIYDQYKFNRGLHMKIKSKIWIETDKGILISEGRIQLLKLIESTGSLNKAAKEMNISYQKAWKLIDASNKASKDPLIATQVGGNKGGGTVVTPYGKSLIESFEKINVACWEFLDLQLKKHSL